MKARTSTPSAPQHPYLQRPVLPAEKQLRKIITLPALSLIAFAIETEDSPPQTITFPDVFDSQEYVAYHADRHLLRSKRRTGVTPGYSWIVGVGLTGSLVC